MTETELLKISHPLTIFLLGATGDLAKKKIYPALYRLYQKRLLPSTFTIIGNARSALTRPEYQTMIKTIIRPTNQVEWYTFEQNIFFVSGDISQVETFEDIARVHQQLAADLRCGNHMWLVATLPQLYVPAIKAMKQVGVLHSDCGWTKFLLEKPFGTDLASSRQLTSLLRSVLQDDQIFRIDHFLGKETVQNLVAFRFANGLFESSWDHHHVDHIQVTMAEQGGIEGREQFYDATGLLRDVVQNHLLQLLAVTLMEEPVSLHSQDIRLQRSALLKKLAFASATKQTPTVLYGQYTKGVVDGAAVQGYRDNARISSRSWTETAFAAQLCINTPRWKGVPIYLRAGKRFAKNRLEISIIFKDRPNQMFTNEQTKTGANVLTFRFQPNEGIQLRLYVKQPGYGHTVESVPFKFTYQHQFKLDLIEAYERLLYDASVGDPTLFPTATDVDIAWGLIDPLLRRKTDVKPLPYPAGSWGPQAFDDLLARDGREWLG